MNNNPNENQIAQSSWNGNGFRTITGTISGQMFNQTTNSFFINNNSNDNTSSPYIDYLKPYWYQLLLLLNQPQLLHLHYPILPKRFPCR